MWLLALHCTRALVDVHRRLLKLIREKRIGMSDVYGSSVNGATVEISRNTIEYTVNFTYLVWSAS